MPDIDPRLMTFLAGRLEKCPLCKWIHEDLKQHGEFTKDYPHNGNLSSPIFPMDKKPVHLNLEGIVLVDGIKRVILPEDRIQD